jgi:hypothetical protein
VNGDPVVLDGNWPVYQGPDVSLTGRILRFEGDSAGLTTFYQADYSGNVPVFSSGIVTLTSGKERKDVLDVVVYPNPSKGSFSIQSGEKTIFTSIEIYTLNGVLVKRFERADSENLYSTKGLKAGLYIIKIQAGNSYKNVKLMVE